MFVTQTQGSMHSCFLVAPVPSIDSSPLKQSINQYFIIEWNIFIAEAALVASEDNHRPTGLRHQEVWILKIESQPLQNASLVQERLSIRRDVL